MQERKDARDLYPRVVALTAALYRVTELLPRQEPIRIHLRKKADEILAAYCEESREAAAGWSRRLLSKISTIIGFLSVAEGLGNPAAVNFAVLSREYESLVATLRREAQRRAASPKRPSPRQAPLEVSSTHGGTVVSKDGRLLTGQVIKPENGRHIAHAVYAASSSPEKRHVAERASHKPNTEMSGRQRAILERVREVGKVRVSDLYDVFGDVSSKTVQRDLQELVARNLLRKEGEKRWTIYVPNNDNVS